MAPKRDRAAVEAEMQAAQSPFVFYGTPLPPVDDNVRDDGSYVPEWKQEVRDERGRKRFHGAFTGGWSAGYFNTVGSKEGWTPQTFVSSRSKKAEQSGSAQKRPEDFMDEEDFADAAEAQKLQTLQNFTGIGSMGEQGGASNALMDLMRPTGDTAGVKILQKMGWKPGQGIGPKVRRRARDDDDDIDDNDQQTHLFAPENTPMISFVKKNDHKGLGFGAPKPVSKVQKSTHVTASFRPASKSNKRARLSFANDLDDDADDGHVIVPKGRSKVFGVKKPVRKGAFGVGVLNDNGSDDEDDVNEPEYNYSIGGDELKKSSVVRPTGEAFRTQMKTSKLPRKVAPTTDFRKCHDGRLPLDGFVLSTLQESTPKFYAPPIIPPGWQSSKASQQPQSSSSNWQSTAEAAKSSNLDPSARGKILGEQTLPRRSVFEFLTPEARARLVAATGRDDLPAAKGEAIPGSKPLTEREKTDMLWQMVPQLDKELALAAIYRRSSGFMPYADDDNKRKRYEAFLELKAGTRNQLPDRKEGHSIEDWRKEMHEFAQAAEVFKPISGLMASRFTSSSKLYEGGESDSKAGSDSLLSKPQAKQEDPAEAAARMGMYGPMTRSVINFYPTKLVCKRFGVRLPAHVVTDPGEDLAGAATSGAQELVSKTAMEKLMREASWQRRPQSFTRAGVETMEPMQPPVPKEPVVIDTERNEALEQERPGDDVFAAIFGDDDDA